MYFSSNLLFLRKRQKLTQGEIADYLGLTQRLVAFYERGDREPTLECLIGLAKFYEVSIDDLLLKDLRPQGSMLAKNLRYLRTKRNYNQGDMARLLNVSKANMSKYESGFVELNNQGLINISEFFGVTIDDLLKKDLSKEEPL